jgi:hypothetical protein
MPLLDIIQLSSFGNLPEGIFLRDQFKDHSSKIYVELRIATTGHSGENIIRAIKIVR